MYKLQHRRKQNIKNEKVISEDLHLRMNKKILNWLNSCSKNSEVQHIQETDMGCRRENNENEENENVSGNYKQ